MVIKKTWAIVLMIVMLLSVGLTGCGDSGDQGTQTDPNALEDVDTLYVGSYGANWDKGLQVVADQFKEEYGVEVVLDSSYQFSKRIAEGSAPSVDVCLEDDINLAKEVSPDLYMELDLSKIPNYKELYDKAIDPSGLGLAFNWGAYGICYRTDLVQTPPTSWKDFWKDEYAKKIAINRMEDTGGVQFFIQTNTQNGGTYENAEPGWVAYKELAGNLKTLSASTANMADMFTTGEISVAPWWSGRAYGLKDDGVLVDFVTPEEGAYACVTELSIPKGAKAPNLAHAFINMCLDADYQKTMAEIIIYGPTNKNTVITDKALLERIVYGTDQVDDLIFADWAALDKVHADWIDRFDREVVPIVGK